MLQVLKQPQPVHPRPRLPHLHITAHNLAKGHRTKRESALLGARLVAGTATIREFTPVLAADIVGSSPTAVACRLG
jgi:hypothetical protein